MTKKDPYRIDDPQPHAPITKEKNADDFDVTESDLLTCPQCKHLISGADINIEKTIARCGNCQHVFGFSHDSQSRTLKTELVIPEGIEALRIRSEIDLKLKWSKTTSRAGRGFVTLFTLIWNGILLPFVLIAILSGTWVVLLFLSLHLLVGLLFLWSTLAGYFNTTSLNINKRMLKVSSGPFKVPFSGNASVEVNDISQLYVSKYTSSTTNGVPNYAYALYAVLHDGKSICLLRGMNKETQRYMEREIESFLGIRNRSIEGEDR